jgi:putative sugar O-methyltransferase
METDYSRYETVCRQAVANDEVFKTFKSNPDYTYMLEHVTYEQGLGYISEIQKTAPQLIHHIECFATNDSLGTPNTFWYSELNMEISPTTLRYVKVLADLINTFGYLTSLDIVEIGVGYGGQCKIINDYFVVNSYTLIDLPDVLALAKKYLNCYEIQNTVYLTQNDVSEARHDLCLSNYAFTEISGVNQRFYANTVIHNSRRGYITCNHLGQRVKDGGMAVHEIQNLSECGFFIDEVPKTGEHNAIYIWK